MVPQMSLMPQKKSAKLATSAGKSKLVKLIKLL
jgi:hypothetical protein